MGSSNTPFYYECCYYYFYYYYYHYCYFYYYLSIGPHDIFEWLDVGFSNSKILQIVKSKEC